jgi:hypothetical protein
MGFKFIALWHAVGCACSHEKPMALQHYIAFIRNSIVSLIINSEKIEQKGLMPLKGKD